MLLAEVQSLVRPFWKKRESVRPVVLAYATLLVSVADCAAVRASPVGARDFGSTSTHWPVLLSKYAEIDPGATVKTLGVVTP